MLLKDVFRPFDNFTNISKVYEICIYNQIQHFFNYILSSYQFQLLTGFNAQYYQVKYIEKQKNV